MVNEQRTRKKDVAERETRARLYRTPGWLDGQRATGYTATGETILYTRITLLYCRRLWYGPPSTWPSYCTVNRSIIVHSGTSTRERQYRYHCGTLYAQHCPISTFSSTAKCSTTVHSENLITLLLCAVRHRQPVSKTPTYSSLSIPSVSRR